MYIFIWEDGGVTKSSVFESDTKQSADDGYLTVIDITDPEEPLIYLEEGWTDLEVFNDNIMR